MVDDDVLHGFRLRLFSLAQELGNVRQACRIFGVHHSTYYRWRGPVLRSGLEMLRTRERRPPRMPNQTSQLTEQRIVAFALGHPGSCRSAQDEAEMIEMCRCISGSVQARRWSWTPRMPSEAAVDRLVTVTLAGLRPSA